MAHAAPAVAHAGYTRLLLGLYGATFLVRASFAMVVVLVSSTYVGLSSFQLGLVLALIPLAELVTVAPAGIANDRYGRRPIFLAGIAIAAVSLVARAAWLDILGLSMLNLLHGVSAAMVLVTSLALLADHAQPETMGREMGVFDFVTLFGYLIGFIAGFLLIDLLAGREHLGFLVAAALAMMAFLFAWRAVEEPKRPQALPEVRLGDLVRVARQARVALVIVPWLIVFMFLASLSSFLERLVSTFGFTGTQTAVGILVIGVVLVVTQIGFGHLSDRFGRPPLMLLGAGGFVVLMTTLAVLILRSAAAPDPNDALLLAVRQQGVLLTIAFFATLAFGPAALAALADEAQTGPTGVTMSLYSLVLALGFFLGPIITGAVVDLGGGVALAVWLELMAVGLAALVWTKYRHSIPGIRSGDGPAA